MTSTERYRADPAVRRAAIERAGRYAATHREERHDAHLRRTYGITGEAYARMLAEQGGVCAICREPETQVRGGKAIRLAVDHDHVTGRVRALLCRRCNHTIGQVREDPALFAAMAAYVGRDFPADA